MTAPDPRHCIRCHRPDVDQFVLTRHTVLICHACGLSWTEPPLAYPDSDREHDRDAERGRLRAVMQRFLHPVA